MGCRPGGPEVARARPRRGETPRAHRSRCRPRSPAATDIPRPSRNRSGCRSGVRSIAATKARGRLGAAPQAQAPAVSGSNRLIAQEPPAIARSITSQIASSTEESSGALAAIFSKTRRSPAAIASAALALGDVGDAGADQPAARARQAHEAHFAGHVLAERVAMHPLEHGCAARERAIDVAARRAERGRAVGLVRRTDLVGAAR